MEKIVLGTVTLATFDKTIPEHVLFMKSLVKDKTILERFQGISRGLLHQHPEGTFFGRGFFLLDNEQLVGYTDICNNNEMGVII